MASPALPGLFFCFAAMVLLIIVSVSAPVWDSISFLDYTQAGRTIHFGVFGYTGSGRATVGYTIPPSIFTIPSVKLNTLVIRHLTVVLILHPIAAGFAAIAAVFGLCGAAYSRTGTVIMTLSAVLAMTITLIAWVVDMVLWGIARNRIRAHGATAQYGNANWLTLGALVALFLAFCAGSAGSCGRYRRSEKV